MWYDQNETSGYGPVTNDVITCVHLKRLLDLVLFFIRNKIMRVKQSNCLLYFEEIKWMETGKSTPKSQLVGMRFVAASCCINITEDLLVNVNSVISALKLKLNSPKFGLKIYSLIIGFMSNRINSHTQTLTIFETVVKEPNCRRWKID